MNQKLRVFIDKTYHEPYNLLTNNCFHKSRRIIRKAKELGVKAHLVPCIVFYKVKCLKSMPMISPHFYAIIRGEKVDVALDPKTEQKVCRNEEVRVLWHTSGSFSRTCSH